MKEVLAQNRKQHNVCMTATVCVSIWQTTPVAAGPQPHVQIANHLTCCCHASYLRAFLLKLTSLASM
jgi:hypothetical protein